MHTGRKHDYLGVDMEFTDDGLLEVSMFKYLQNVIEEFPEKITGRAATPAAGHLFDVRDEKDKHDRWRRNELWHSTTRWHNCSSWLQGRDETSRRLWRFLPHK